MKKNFFLLAAIILLFFIAGSRILYGQEDLHYFDEANPYSEEIRLTIFHPSMGSLHSLLELRKKGLIPNENLIVIGVFHEKQLKYDNLGRDYENAIRYVRENHLEWIRFHKLTGDLWQKNRGRCPGPQLGQLA